MIHKHCFSVSAMEQMKRTKTIVCPKLDCGKKISEFELRETMGKDYEEIEKIERA